MMGLFLLILNLGLIFLYFVDPAKKTLKKQLKHDIDECRELKNLYKDQYKAFEHYIDIDSNLDKNYKEVLSINKDILNHCQKVMDLNNNLINRLDELEKEIKDERNRKINA